MIVSPLLLIFLEKYFEGFGLWRIQKFALKLDTRTFLCFSACIPKTYHSFSSDSSVTVSLAAVSQVFYYRSWFIALVSIGGRYHCTIWWHCQTPPVKLTDRQLLPPPKKNCQNESKTKCLKCWKINISHCIVMTVGEHICATLFR